MSTFSMPLFIRMHSHLPADKFPAEVEASFGREECCIRFVHFAIGSLGKQMFPSEATNEAIMRLNFGFRFCLCKVIQCSL